jgi:predicted permease
MNSLLQDLRYGMRMLLKKPGFTLIAVLTLALGIGANTAVFTLINALLLRALPVKNPHELVVINALNARGQSGLMSFPVYRDLRERQEVFTDILAASAGDGSVRLTIPAQTGTVELDNIRPSLVSGNYWSVLGVEPALGRFFTEDKDRSEAAGLVVVLSYAFWARQFGRDPGVLDRTVIINRSPCRVIGVAPRGFFGEKIGSEPDFWAPLVSFSSRDLLEKGHRFPNCAYLGRLKPGVSRRQAQAAMTLLFQQLLQAERPQAPSSNPNRAPAIRDYYVQLESAATGLSFGFPQGLRQTFARPLWIIMAIVALVLLIACANVANLLLARAVARQREISVRLALGCSRFRLLRQLLTESLLLSALGTAVGSLVAWWGSHALLRMVDTGYGPPQLDLSPDARVLLFTAAVMVLTGIGFGLAPAWRASGVDLTSVMKDQARGTGGRVRQYLGRTLIVCQVALSLLLLIGASLLIGSLHNLRQIDLGFWPEQILLFDLAHKPTNQEPAALARVAREVRERVRQIPGVERASVSHLMLFGGYDLLAGLGIRGYTPAPDETVPAHFNWVSPGYFETLGMSLVAGRGIEERAAENAPLTAVINETLARRYFPSGNAIGRIMEITAFPFAAVKNKPIEIVGVVRDAKYNNLRAEAKPMFYLSIQQVSSTLGTLEVRSREPLATLAGPVRNALLEVTRDVMIRRVVTLSDHVDQTLAIERMLATLCTFFGALALLLAAVGLYGVLSYAVAQRTQEIGIRMALGATGRNVLWLVLRQSLRVVVIGIALGLSLALVCTRLLSTFLYGLSPTDPLAIVLSLLLLILVALVACYLPARRATKVDPMVALKCE